MAINVTDWLHSLGLEQYADAFRDNDLDGEVLPEVNADDLIAIGVTSIGHRRKLLAAIAALKSEVGPAAGASPSADPIPTLVSAARSTDAERRQLTVMFCDLVGSTALSAQLDPEELSNVIGAFQKACASAVGVFGGSIAKYMGDGALVYFGYPEAHEDDAERAIRAGLALLDAMMAMHLPVPVPPQVRVGIATGLVVVGELIGEGGAQERVAVGETLNLAARIQAVAPPDTVVVGELTHRLAGAAFDYQGLGQHEFKGIPEAVRLWRVLGESGARGRFNSRVVKGLTPLVGREEELGLLRRRWDYAKDSEGHLAGV
jgi:class 3 adenylate cyclase